MGHILWRCRAGKIMNLSLLVTRTFSLVLQLKRIAEEIPLNTILQGMRSFMRFVYN